ncbi:MAG: 50S ribosomal protein L17 [Ignavibacteria bacterium]|nr:50S ribosomal protein L17 [Ignavibacteria bacterium]
MEHRKKGRKLKRTASHKKAMLSNMAVSLIKNKRIETTVAKAKELRTFLEPIITKARRALKYKDDEVEKKIHQRREARKHIKDKEALNILFNEIANKVLERNGGYLRILKSGYRLGDGADKAIVEFVDYDIAADLKAKEKEKEKQAKKSGKKETKTSEKSAKK